METTPLVELSKNILQRIVFHDQDAPIKLNTT